MRTYQAETHCHTTEVSCCARVPAETIVDKYAGAGYKYLFITDHYNPSTAARGNWARENWDDAIDFYEHGYRLAKERAKGTGLTVLQGMELTLGYDPDIGLGNDFLVYGFDRAFLTDNPFLFDLTYGQFGELARAHGLLVFQAHPYRNDFKPVEPVFYDGIEIVNAHPRHFSHNMMAYNFASEHGLYTIGGSDTHAEEDVGRGGVMLPSGIETPRDFVQYYRENGSPELIVTYGA